jgi:hypothetical protein
VYFDRGKTRNQPEMPGYPAKMNIFDENIA